MNHPFSLEEIIEGEQDEICLKPVSPQIIPQFLSNYLYTFEINIRASVVLGLVGAGGIGTEISNAIGNYQYNKIGAILIPLFILVFVLQIISNEVKKRTV